MVCRLKRQIHARLKCFLTVRDRPFEESECVSSISYSDCFYEYKYFVQHPNIVKYKGFVKTREYLYIILEYVVVDIRGIPC